MTDPIAILLIIGSAAVGPIEAQCRHDGRVFPCRPGEFVTHDVKRETVAEACARAMKDIGAVPGTWNWPSARPWQQFFVESDNGADWALRPVPYGRVRCIPAPRGLR